MRGPYSALHNEGALVISEMSMCLRAGVDDTEQRRGQASICVQDAAVWITTRIDPEKTKHDKEHIAACFVCLISRNEFRMSIRTSDVHDVLSSTIIDRGNSVSLSKAASEIRRVLQSFERANSH